MNGFRRGSFHTNASLTSMLQRFSDIFIVFCGLYLSCLMSGTRFSMQHWVMVLTSIVIFQMIGGITDFYRSWRGVRAGLEIQLILQNWTISLLLTSGAVAFVNDFSNEYIVYIQWYLLVCCGLVITRSTIRLMLSYMRNLGFNTRNVAIMGSMPVGIRLAETLRDAHWMGFRVLGIYDDSKEPLNALVERRGNLAQLIEDAKCGRIDRIYIAMSMEQEKLIKDTVSELSDTTCSVMLIPDIFTFNILQSRSEEINGVPVVSLFDTPMSGVNQVIKRVEDIVLSILILLFISPVLLLISAMVKFTSHGPVIFKQRRYGMDGKAIEVWKFRSMKVMENGDKVIQATKGDVRITPVGAFLRRTSLDELPQFINVLKGDMSIVGPRPHAVAHNEQYRKLIKGYMLRHKMKPGITGWAQINGWRGETDTLDKMEKRVEFDLDYIRNWSVWLDVKIVFLTIFKGFISKTAY
ncbi:Putative colanic biosynthesis UDP-glucose lipid carrier transferase [Serratia quinivorans]|jgi:putative colanic acid biosynthesis UDP-glucose lipid carrier transferase|uniref:Undecaprenyl-phosphate glucose phosphotransferase n=1 Tax=Serratia quinivorans TaxID=137545 RepID=A0ABV3UCR2_9GAMM|nr:MULTISPECIES: undecaprenyl-phosphate glucose phosphotransferase [Serratia]CAI1526925.1 Putative colanic biosynthesis UDP-glucose lipid carrier transferase [Serratia quinivorans]CAI1718931.1 Putative colanic biosynthesis UDP-glucose lipid carrier transferase [Serratia quinivorans]